MKRLYLEKMFNIEEGIFYGFVDNSKVSHIFYQKDVAELVLENIIVTYNVDNDDVINALNSTIIKYIEVATDSDDSGETDIYEHNFYLCEDGIKLDQEGVYIKTYKREKSAITYANSLGYKVVIN